MKRINSIKRIYEKLADEESKRIFEARLEFVFERNMTVLEDRLWNISSYKEYSNAQLERYFLSHDKSKVIICGAGQFGRKCRYLLEKYGIRVSYFCDNDETKIGTSIDNVLCLSVDEVCQKYKEYTVIPISPLYRKELFDQLITGFFPQENILYLRSGKLSLVCEKQYFDFNGIKPQEKNVFVDAGSYNGQTTFDFIKWCDNNYDKVFCFEPNENNFSNVVEKLKGTSNVEIVNAGTWNEERTLSFCSNGPASKITEDNSDCSINVTTIDKVVKEEKVTFIKMDVEGAELESLLGARNTIIKNKPDLAICIYHKWLDFIDLPDTILDLVPEYKFAIRHYSNNTTETVLYAYIDKK